jgi:hypothetical protein
VGEECRGFESLKSQLLFPARGALVEYDKKGIGAGGFHEKGNSNIDGILKKCH